MQGIVQVEREDWRNCWFILIRFKFHDFNVFVLRFRLKNTSKNNCTNQGVFCSTSNEGSSEFSSVLFNFFAVIESSKPSYNNISLHFKQKPEHLEIKVSSTTTFISSAKSLPARCISISQNLLVIHFDVFPHKILYVFVLKCGEKRVLQKQHCIIWWKKMTQRAS